MNKEIITVLISIVAIAVGFAIGFWFGSTQNAALIQNKKKYESGKLKNGFFIMPGSMGRISMLLIILVAIQIAIPIFFQGNIQWILSTGIIVGYGWTFVKQLRNHTIYHS
jgi:hypothetical protein